MWLPGALQLPWLNFLLVNAPDPYYGGYSWYDIETGNGIGESRRLLFQLLDGLRNIPPARSFCAAFRRDVSWLLKPGRVIRAGSRELWASAAMSMSRRQLIRELSPVARQQRFLLTHGTHDPLIPIQKMRQQTSLLKAAGLEIDWREFMKAHAIAGEEEGPVIRQFVQECYAGTPKA